MQYVQWPLEGLSFPFSFLFLFFLSPRSHLETRSREHEWVLCREDLETWITEDRWDSSQRIVIRFREIEADEHYTLGHWFLTGIPQAFCKCFAKLSKLNFFFFIIITTLEEFCKIFQKIKFKYIY